MINSLKIIKYTSDLADIWDDFVRNKSRNGNIFHEISFLSYHGERFEDCSVLIFNETKSKILAVIPAAIKREQNKVGIVSHPGSTYGGLVFNDKIKTRDLKTVIDALIKYYYKCYNADFIQMTLAENFHTNDFFEVMTFLLWHRGFKIVSKEASCARYLQVEDFYPKFSRSTRNLVNQFLKKNSDVAIHFDVEDLTIPYQIIEKNLLLHGTKPTHTLDELLLLKHKLKTRLKCFTASKDGNIVATIVVFELNNKVVHDFYNAQNYEYNDATILRYLFLRVFQYYRDRNYLYFNFGISSRDKWIKWGILEYKEQFGSEVLTRDTWILENLNGDWPYDGQA